MKLAIRGNEENGGMVITILEGLGGKNKLDLKGNAWAYFYYINDNGVISFIPQDKMIITEFETHTCKSFLESYREFVPSRHYTKEVQDFMKITQDMVTFRMHFTTFLLKYNENITNSENILEMNSIFKKVIDLDKLIQKVAHNQYGIE